MNGVRAFAVGALGGEEGVCAERLQCGGLAHARVQRDGVREGTSPDAGYY